MGTTDSDSGRPSGVESSRGELLTMCTLGPLGTLSSYLWVADGSSPDIPGPNSASSRVDTVVAIPVLHWEPCGNSTMDRVAVRMQATAVDAFEMEDGGFPLVMRPPEDLHFSIDEGNLRIWRERGTAGVFQERDWPIESRLAWFLKQTGTVSLVISDGSTAWVSTALNAQHYPSIAHHRGTIQQRNFTQILNRSTSWAVGVLGNLSLSADMRDMPDDHFDIYVSDETGWQLPDRLEHVGSCLSCERKADSREHCTPDWMARDHGVQPVTAHLFCIECNNYFGKNLERPVASLYRQGTLPREIHGELFAQWAIKTALTLSSASGVRLQPHWMTELRNGKTPSGFEIYAVSDVAQERTGYTFGTTMMSAARHAAGAFLTTFSMPQLAFVVTRSKPQLGAFGPFPRVHPSPKAAREPQRRVDLTALHGDFLAAITGHPVGFTSKPGRRPQHRH